MLISFMTSIAAFISTNIDDIFVLMLLFPQAENEKDIKSITIGQYLGIGLLTIVSILGAFGIQCISLRYIAFLGIVPIILGIREWQKYKREEKSVGAFVGQEKTTTDIKIMSVMLLAIANGADNIGLYVPLFAGYNPGEKIVAYVVFMIMTGVWCFIGKKIAGLSWLKEKLLKYKHRVVPIVFILLGICIIVENILG